MLLRALAVLVVTAASPSLADELPPERIALNIVSIGTLCADAMEDDGLVDEFRGYAVRVLVDAGQTPEDAARAVAVMVDGARQVGGLGPEPCRIGVRAVRTAHSR